MKVFLRRFITLRRLNANITFLRHAMREGLWRRIFSINKKARLSKFQQPLTWNTPLHDCHEISELLKWFNEHDVHYVEGRHTIYIPPQEVLKLLFPSIVDFYPENSGFKILKDFRHPYEARYLDGNQPVMRHRLIGKPTEQVITANYMYSLKLTARVWDISIWKSNSTYYTVFVVDHVEGTTPSNEQFKGFIKNLEKLDHSTKLKIIIPKWKVKSDFKQPDCNGNLIYSSKYRQLLYIDFQNFRIENATDWMREIVTTNVSEFHFGGGRIHRGSEYLYQSIPFKRQTGKRNILKRWLLIRELLRDAGLEIARRMILDIGCNAGMIIYSALNDGASWALGWDRPNVICNARDLLFSLGATRFHLYGANLNDRYQLINDIPANLNANLREAVVFYLSIWQHIGFLKSLQELPWRALVFEGHQNQGKEEFKEIISDLISQDVRLASLTRIADGDSSSRPIALLVRE